MKSNHSHLSGTVRRLLILVPFVITGGFLSVMYLYFTTPVYESNVSFKAPAAATQQASLSLFPTKTTAVTEEITSKEFLQRALKESPSLIQTYITTDFRTTAENYAFPYSITFQPTGNKNYQKQSYIIHQLNDVAFILETHQYGHKRTKQGKFGEELIDNNIALVINKKEKASNSTAYTIKKPEYTFIIHSPSSLAEELLATNNRISINDNDGVIALAIRSENPRHATSIASNVASAYLQNKNASNQEQIKDDVDSQIEIVSQQLTETEQEISNYKRANQITDINSETEKSLSLLKELQLQKSTLELQMAALNNLSNYLRKNREINNSQVEYGAIQDQAFAQQIDRLNQAYSEKNAGAGATKETEIENLKLLISERILNTRKRTAVQIDQINQNINAAQNRISKIPEQANALLSLERKMALDKKVYDMLIEKKATSIVGNVNTTTGGKILKPATQPLTPIYPVNWLVLMVGVLSGSVCGLTLLAVKNRMKQTNVNNKEELAGITGLPFIASIPEEPAGITSATLTVSNLCTSILIKPQVKVITFASTATQEGKTFIATRLAQSLAAVDKKVLLMDMNLDNPEIAAKYSLTPHNNLATVVQGSSDVHDAICLTTYPNLEVLTAGTLPAGINTFLSSDKKDKIMADLKKHYDYIIIDTSGCSYSSDALAMMKLSDLNLYIVRSNTTRKASLHTAEQIQQDHQISNMHLVLNADVRTSNSNTYSRTRNRKVNIKHNKGSRRAQDNAPSILKRIALWFY